MISTLVVLFLIALCTFCNVIAFQHVNIQARTGTTRRVQFLSKIGLHAQSITIRPSLRSSRLRPLSATTGSVESKKKSPFGLVKSFFACIGNSVYSFFAFIFSILTKPFSFLRSKPSSTSTSSSTTGVAKGEPKFFTIPSIRIAQPTKVAATPAPTKLSSTPLISSSVTTTTTTTSTTTPPTTPTITTTTTIVPKEQDSTSSTTSTISPTPTSTATVQDSVARKYAEDKLKEIEKATVKAISNKPNPKNEPGRWPPHVDHPAPRKKSVGSLSEADLKGKRVLVRCDLNVPLSKEGVITDDTRIRGSIPTIEYLVNKGAKVLLTSHLGRPKGGYEKKFSLAPIAPRLAELLKKEVKLVPDCIGVSVGAAVSKMSDGDVVLLENSRFYPEEEKNDPLFAKLLAENADLFVNDAFGTAHRAHASTEGVTAFLHPAVSGFLLQKELDYLQGAVNTPKRPFAAIVGGSKVSSKISVIEAMLNKVDKLVLGGGMVFTFLKARGLSVGNSLVEDDQLELARKLERIAKEKKVELFLATDVVVADRFAADANTQVVPVESIPDGWMGLDIGPDTIETLRKGLANCRTVIWNGPMGVFEFDAFAKGTNAIATTLASLTTKGCITIIGGGDSVAAVEKAGLADQMSHISTGGGASLELLEGKVLPGIAALNE
eukprot:CAMPEP_0170067826 /NCGR_PEP_ID=MMETSP0019_2-20121128/7017_1 /TAXON_ID=98059 /ORGANISM="Dinobryon sp., Strain UTEXLB2267" /LENGTH=661 /DNA_ID=CAMNT_0010275291 /DNA_START=86 /DNA_END=2071 /DNA_ORIENTATION=-